MSSHVLTNTSPQAAAFEMLMNAVGSGLSPVIQQLLNSDPNLVHLKGFHGMTALHRACLIGDYNIVLMLVQANSDVNALTNFNETPLHYASKRGKPSVVHLLIQCGARLDLKDNNGKGAIIHAAEGGAVQVMRYFEDAFGVSMKVVDSNLQSPIHYACVYGHLDLFMFLMKSGRCDLRQVDSAGDLPIHIAAKNGFGFMTWSMLCNLGIPVLRQANKAGLTPLDLVLQSDDYGQKELAPVLVYYSKQADNTPVTGPVFRWYFLLFFPPLLFMAVVLISQAMGTHQYAVFLLGSLLFLLTLKRLNHRMKDVSRWPNPFFAGFFAGGIFHSTLCYFWLMFQYQFTSLGIFILSLTLCPALYVVFYKIIRQDPGIVTVSVKEPTSGKPLTMVDLCKMQNPPYNYCVFCDLITTDLTKHCKLCNHCFLHMDHHCLFLLKCVAHNNHVLFVWLLILAAFNMICYCFGFLVYINQIYPDVAYSQIFFHLLHEQAWPFTLFFLNFISTFWSLSLLHFQYILVTKGCTAYFNDFEVTSFKLSHTEALNNFFHFLLSKPLPYPNPRLPILSKEGQASAKLRELPTNVRVKEFQTGVNVV